MSKKSNLKRTHRRRKTKAYNEAKVTAKHEDVVQQQKAAREAYREIRSIRQKRVFTAGAKAAIASVAIMLMFLAGIVSWSVVKNARQRRDEDQAQQEQQPSQMVTADMVTGMGRDASEGMSGRLRFSSFAKTAGGYDGKGMFGGRTPSEGIDGISAERTRLEEDWQRRAEERTKDAGSEGQSIADKVKDPSGGAKSAEDATSSRYKVIDSADDVQIGASTDPDGTQDGSEDARSSVTDEQIRKLIDSAEATASR